jgi:hypothetical protein
MEMIKFNALVADLKKLGVEFPRDLVVVGVGASEQILGEIQWPEGDVRAPGKIVGKAVLLKNPKRFMRLQTVTPKGVAVQFLIGDMDMVESGIIQVFPVYGYYLRDLDPQSFGSMLELYREFLEMKARRDSKLVVPDQAILSKLR